MTKAHSSSESYGGFVFMLLCMPTNNELIQWISEAISKWWFRIIMIYSEKYVSKMGKFVEFLSIENAVHVVKYILMVQLKWYAFS